LARASSSRELRGRHADLVGVRDLAGGELEVAGVPGQGRGQVIAARSDGAALDLHHPTAGDRQPGLVADRGDRDEDARLALELEQRQERRHRDLGQVAAQHSALGATAGAGHRAPSPDHQLLVEKRPGQEIADAQPIGLEADVIGDLVGDQEDRQALEARVDREGAQEAGAIEAGHRQRRDHAVGARGLTRGVGGGAVGEGRDLQARVGQRGRDPGPQRRAGLGHHDPRRRGGGAGRRVSSSIRSSR
jgi:hypothetical protein